jgi:hypothetical protein
MSLDKLLEGVESQFAEQSDLLQIAHVWREKTNGRVSPEVTFNANDYIRLLMRSLQN